MISANQKELILEKLCPLGQVPKYEYGELTLSDTPTRRFIHDGYHVKRLPRSKALVNKSAYNPAYLGFGINEALGVLIQEDFHLYNKLFNLCEKFDQLASEFINECEQTAVLFNHESFGDRLFPHIHAQSNNPGKTVSFFYNLTNTSDRLPELTFLEPVFEGDKAFDKGYTQHKLMMVHERNSKKEVIEISSGDVVVFDSTHIPHSFSFTEDIWLTFVYDHANVTQNTFKKNSIQLLDSDLYYNVFSIPV